MLKKILIGLAALSTALVIAVLSDRSSTPPILDSDGKPLPKSITSFEEVEINGIKQQFLIRGADKDLPVLLFVHGGLGTPYSALGHTFQREWEKNFVVVHWEQRGSGRLYRNADPDTITTDQLLDDTQVVAEYLNTRFGKKVYIMGHSWGAYLAYRTAAMHPDLFEAYIGVGQTIGLLKEDQYSHTWAIEEATRRGDKKGFAQMESISPPPYDDVAKAYGVKYGLIDKYGGFFPKGGMFFMVKSVFTSPEYTIMDAMRYVRGIQNYQNNLLGHEREAMWTFSVEDIQKIEIPVYFIYGSRDQVTPGSVLEEYTRSLEAPSLEVIRVDDAAHFPFVDQREEFTRILRERVLKITST